MPKAFDLRKSTITAGAPKLIGRNHVPTIREFEEARINGRFPAVIHVSSIDEVIVALGGKAGALGDRKQFHYLMAKPLKVLPQHVNANIKTPPAVETPEGEKPLYAGQPKKRKKQKAKRHLVLVKEVAND